MKSVKKSWYPRLPVRGARLADGWRAFLQLLLAAPPSCPFFLPSVCSVNGFVVDGEERRRRRRCIHLIPLRLCHGDRRCLEQEKGKWI